MTGRGGAAVGRIGGTSGPARTVPRRRLTFRNWEVAVNGHRVSRLPTPTGTRLRYFFATV
jgi:hypothetical protein